MDEATLSGGFYGALDPDSKEALAHAKMMYQEVRSRKTDAKSIAENIGWSLSDIEQVKAHMFTETHPFKNGTIRLFDPSFEQVQAWDRLTQGQQTDLDVLLLHHELLKSKIMQTDGTFYEDAHERANKQYNWQLALIKSTKGVEIHVVVSDEEKR